MLPFCVSTFEASHSESEFSFSKECADTCVSRSPRLSVKGCNQSGMPCVGSSLFISSSLCADSRFPEASLSGSVCIGFLHARLSLRDLMMFRIHRKILTDPFVSMWKSSCCWKMMTILVRREVRRCPSHKARARISLMRFTFLDNVSRWPFSFPHLNFVPRAS